MGWARGVLSHKPGSRHCHRLADVYSVTSLAAGIVIILPTAVWFFCACCACLETPSLLLEQCWFTVLTFQWPAACKLQHPLNWQQTCSVVDALQSVHQPAVNNEIQGRAWHSGDS